MSETYLKTIHAHRGGSVDSVTILTIVGQDTKIQHYLEDEDVVRLIATLQNSQVPRWVIASPTEWRCSRCARKMTTDEKPALCSCASRAALSPAEAAGEHNGQ